jgi:hypothetical protein
MPPQYYVEILLQVLFLVKKNTQNYPNCPNFKEIEALCQGSLYYTPTYIFLCKKIGLKCELRYNRYIKIDDVNKV